MPLPKGVKCSAPTPATCLTHPFPCTTDLLAHPPARGAHEARRLLLGRPARLPGHQLQGKWGRGVCCWRPVLLRLLSCADALPPLLLLWLLPWRVHMHTRMHTHMHMHPLLHTAPPRRELVSPVCLSWPAGILPRLEQSRAGLPSGSKSAAAASWWAPACPLTGGRPFHAGGRRTNPKPCTLPFNSHPLQCTCIWACCTSCSCISGLMHPFPAHPHPPAARAPPLACFAARADPAVPGGLRLHQRLAAAGRRERGAQHRAGSGIS